MRDLLKSKPRMQRHAGRLLAVDAGDDRVMSDPAGPLDQIRKDRRPDPAAMKFVMNVNRIFDGEAIRRLRS